MAKSKRKPTQNQHLYQKELSNLKRRIKLAEKAGFIFEKSPIPEKPSRITKPKIQELTKLKGDILRRKATGYVIKDTGEFVSSKEGIKAQKSEASQKAKVTKAKKIFISDITTSKKEEYKHVWDSLSQDEQERIFNEWWNNLSKEEKREKITEIIDENLDDIIREDFYANSEFHTEEQLSEDINTEEIYETLYNVQAELQNWIPDSQWSTGLSDAKTQDKNILESMLQGAIDEYGEETVARRLKEHASEVLSIVQEILYASGSKEGNFKDGNTQVNYDITLMSSILTGGNLTQLERKHLAEVAESLEVNN